MRQARQARQSVQKRRRSFLFRTSSDSWHGVLCRNCGWSRRRRRRDPQQVFEEAEGHDCPGVETVAETEAREAAVQAGEATR